MECLARDDGVIKMYKKVELLNKSNSKYQDIYILVINKEII